MNLPNIVQQPDNRIIKVTGYDLINNRILGMYGNEKCEVFIKPEKEASYDKHLLRNPERHVNRKWLGHKIDSRMQNEIPINSQIMLEQSIIVDNNNHILMIEGSYINPVENKLEQKFDRNYKSEQIEQILAKRVLPNLNERITHLKNINSNESKEIKNKYK